MSELGTGYIVKFKLETNKEGINANTIDFSIDFFVRKRRRVTFKRADLIYSDGYYYALLDSTELKLGDLRAEITIDDPEYYWEGTKRPVILERYTGLMLGDCECIAEPIEDECICFDQGYKVTFSMVNEIGGTPDVPPEEVDDYIYYGHIVEPITSFNQVTPAMIVNPINGFQKVPLRTLGRTSIGMLHEGDKIAVLIPANSPLVATKDNGLNNKTIFNTLIMGSNGDATTIINTTRYKVYGELMVVDGEVFIYID